MDLGLEGKSVIVTAASKGLGKASAKQFAAEGANVLISSRNEAQLKAAVKEIQSETGSNKISFATCDITEPEDIKRMVELAVQLHGTVDVLVNNAGGPPAGDFDQFLDQQWQKAFELNLLSFVRTIRHVLPHMRETGAGRIVNIASSSIKQPIDHLILSNTFRAGITGLSKSLSQELAADGILINTVGPGRIATGRVRHLDENRADQLNISYEQIKQSSEKAIPLGRYGNPKEFARVIVFLCSEANSYMTGQSLLVDGGMVKAL